MDDRSSSLLGDSLPKTLLCVLANPPVTSGARTMSRVELACATLLYDRVIVENLFATPSRSTNDISLLGRSENGWVAARQLLTGALTQANGVLLAYGVAEPTGIARSLHRDQVAWLKLQIAMQGLPVFQFGDGPRHPSRWHRWTSKTHSDLPLSEAIHRGLTVVGFDETVG